MRLFLDSFVAAERGTADPSTALRSGMTNLYWQGAVVHRMEQDLSSRPERTRIFYYAAPTMASRAAFRKVVHRCISCPRQRVQPISGCPILRVLCEGWDTTNLDTDGRVSHPLQRAQRMGHPPIRGLIENLFLIRKPHEARGNHSIQQKIRGSAVEGSPVLPEMPHVLYRRDVPETLAL